VDKPPARLFLIFFCDTPRRAWWANALRPGFRHIAAVSWYAAEERWLYFDPALHGTSIRIVTEDQAGQMFDRMLARSAAVVRFASPCWRTSRRTCSTRSRRRRTTG
jgi:hypothetical protein